MGAVERFPNRLDDIVQLLNHLVIPEPDHSKSAAFNRRCANKVASLGFVAAVLPTVELNDDARGRAREVSYVSANRHLPPELEAQFAMPKPAP